MVSARGLVSRSCRAIGRLTGSRRGEDDAEFQPLFDWHQCRVWIVFTIFVLLRSIDRVFYKRVVDRLANYQLFFAAFLVNIGTQVMTIFLTVAYVWYKRFYEKDTRYTLCDFFSPRTELASGKGRFPQMVLWWCSAAQQVGNVLTSLPTSFLGMTTIGLLLNFTLITTMMFAVGYLGTKFHRAHYVGCALIIVSSIASMTVELQTGSIGTYIDANGKAEQSSPMWYLVFIAGTVPMGFANVYNQKYLQETDLDVVWSSYWGGWWQLLAGFLFFPINWMPLPAPATYQNPADTMTYLWNGCLCTIGIAPTDDPLDQVCAAGGGAAAVWFGAYLCCTMTFNVLLCWLTKYMSATWATIGSVLCLDLSALLSMCPLLMGSEARPVTIEQYVGLSIAGIAMIVYNFEDEETPTSIVAYGGPDKVSNADLTDVENRISAVSRARADSRASSRPRCGSRADSLCEKSQGLEYVLDVAAEKKDLSEQLLHD